MKKSNFEFELSQNTSYRKFSTFISLFHFFILVLTFSTSKSSELLKSKISLFKTEYPNTIKQRISTKSGNDFFFKEDPNVQEIQTGFEFNNLLKYLFAVELLNRGQVDSIQQVQKEDLEQHLDSLSSSVSKSFRISPSDKSYMVLFYASWCHHCHNFAPVWRKLSEMFRCTEGIKFFAFECSSSRKALSILPDDPKNSTEEPEETAYQFCATQSVHKFPSMRIFVPANLMNKELLHLVEKQEQQDKEKREFAKQERKEGNSLGGIESGGLRSDSRSLSAIDKNAEGKIEVYKNENNEILNDDLISNDFELESQTRGRFVDDYDYDDIKVIEGESGEEKKGLEKKDLKNDYDEWITSVIEARPFEFNSIFNGFNLTVEPMMYKKYLVEKKNSGYTVAAGRLFRVYQRKAIKNIEDLKRLVFTVTPVQTVDPCGKSGTALLGAAGAGLSGAAGAGLSGAAADFHNQPVDVRGNQEKADMNEIKGRFARKSRWDSILLSQTKKSSNAVEKTSADTRLHDAVEGLLYMLRNWVIHAADPVILSDINTTELREHGEVQTGDDNRVKLILKQEVLRDLKQIIAVISVLLPGENLKLHLIDFYLKLESKESLSMKDFNKFVDTLELAGLRAAPAGERPVFYDSSNMSSSIWLLFHMLSTAMLNQQKTIEHLQQEQQKQQEQLQNLFQTKQTISRAEQVHHLSQISVDPWLVAKTMRTTISRFFQCDECRFHFLKFFDNCYADLCNWVQPSQKSKDNSNTYYADENDESNTFKIRNTTEGFLLWLWRFHNAVTFRTAAERTAGLIVSLEQELKKTGAVYGGDGKNDTDIFIGVGYQNQDVRFPPESLCPKCRKSSIFSDKTRVSISILRPLVFKEKIARGEIQNLNLNDVDSVVSDNSRSFSLNDDIWDVIDDFDLGKIRDFLVEYFWNPEWNSVTAAVGSVPAKPDVYTAAAPVDVMMNLMWDATERKFQTSLKSDKTFISENVKILNENQLEDSAANSESGERSVIETLDSRIAGLDKNMKKKPDLWMNTDDVLSSMLLLVLQNKQKDQIKWNRNDSAAQPQSSLSRAGAAVSITTAIAGFGCFSLLAISVFIYVVRNSRRLSSSTAGYFSSSQQKPSLLKSLFMSMFAGGKYKKSPVAAPTSTVTGEADDGRRRSNMDDWNEFELDLENFSLCNKNNDGEASTQIYRSNLNNTNMMRIKNGNNLINNVCRNMNTDYMMNFNQDTSTIAAESFISSLSPSSSVSTMSTKTPLFSISVADNNNSISHSNSNFMKERRNSIDNKIMKN